MERRVKPIFVFFGILLFTFSWIGPAVGYQLNAVYNVKLRNGKALQGKLVKIDSTTLTIETTLNKKKQTVQRADVVQASRPTRVYTLDDLQNVAELSYQSKAGPAEKENRKALKTYAGTKAERWISEAMRLGLESREVEAAYDQSVRQCQASKSTDQIACLRAKETMAKIEDIRQQYKQLLNLARKDAISVAWVDTHYKWGRWGKEWKN